MFMSVDTQQAAAPGFPSWPMNCLAFYNHLANDYARCVGALRRSADPAQAARAEGDYGVRVMHDMMEAWYGLALAPFTAMAKTMTVEQTPGPSTAEAG
jgi:hypothetical protein